MIKFIKKDFARVRLELESIARRKIPFVLFLIYYIVVGTIGIALLPFMMIYLKIKYKVDFSVITKALSRDFRGEA